MHTKHTAPLRHVLTKLFYHTFCADCNVFLRPRERVRTSGGAPHGLLLHFQDSLTENRLLRTYFHSARVPCLLQK